MVKIGDKIQITSIDNDYYKGYLNKIWEVEAVYHNDKENPLYDMGMYPDLLIECKGLPFALYEYEFEIV